MKIRKLNHKGMSIIEIVLTFSLIMVIALGLLNIVINYREKASLSLKKLEMDTFKNTLTKDIQKDITSLGVKEINMEGGCNTISGLNKCINIVFQDGSQKVLGTSLIRSNDKNSIENKFLYYDGEKYRLKDTLPEKIPSGRSLLDFQSILIEDNTILSTDSVILEDGTTILIYSIDIDVTHLDFNEDFGIHIVATTDSK